jgi:choice-of-anchor A domain-containing protein
MVSGGTRLLGRARRRCALVAVVGGAAAGSCAALGLLASPAGAVGCLSVGPAGNYSEYATNGVSQSSDTVAGAAAYGGPSNSVGGLHVGSGLGASAISLVLGASSTVNNTVLVNGSAQYVGTLSGGTGNTGTFTQESSQSSLPIQFGPAQTALANAATSLAALTATDTASGSGTLSLTSSGSGTDVFDIASTQLQNASSIAITAPLGAVVVVNVSGSNLALSGQSVTLGGGVLAANVIWNMPSGSSTSDSYSAVTWSGTIIQSAGFFSMSASHIDGSILTGATSPSFSANTVSLDLFNGCNPGTGTPEVPFSLLLPIAGIGMLGGALLYGRRRQSRIQLARI